MRTPRFEEIFEAVRQGDSAKVGSLIDTDNALVNVADHNQVTPLTRAFAYGHLDLALSLIKRGANPFAMNHSDKWGMRYIVEKGGLSDEQRRRFVDAVIGGSPNRRNSPPGLVASSTTKRSSKRYGIRMLNELRQFLRRIQSKLPSDSQI